MQQQICQYWRRDGANCEYEATVNHKAVLLGMPSMSILAQLLPFHQQHAGGHGLLTDRLTDG
jgi:hypothetical protein